MRMTTVTVNVQLQFDVDEECSDFLAVSQRQIDRVNEILSVVEDESQPQILGANSIDHSDIKIGGEDGEE